MAYKFKLPELGEGMAEGEIASWLVKEGDTVKEDDSLVEIQNDKDTKTIIEIHNKELDMNHLLELSRGETNNV